MEDSVKNLNVLYEDNHIIVVEKIQNVPSQKDSSCDIDMLTATDLALLCNEEVIAVNQDALGKGAG